MTRRTERAPLRLRPCVSRRTRSSLQRSRSFRLSRRFLRFPSQDFESSRRASDHLHRTSHQGRRLGKGSKYRVLCQKAVESKLRIDGNKGRMGADYGLSSGRRERSQHGSMGVWRRREGKGRQLEVDSELNTCGHADKERKDGGDGN